MKQKINCPNCNAEIIFDTYALLQGVKFQCMNCHAKISLSGESEETVKDAMHKFEEMKKNVMKTKKDKK